MEVMEDGNLMDKVRVLLQRDMEYYEQHQQVLQEALCPNIVGGALDFPHYASFAAIKLVTWLEQHHLAVFCCPSGLINDTKGIEGQAAEASAAEFAETVNSASEQLLSHLHILSQEALDHADLQVLTCTLGTASVVANALWIYNLAKDKYPKNVSMAKSLKELQDMVEAMAERLLDLHTRLVSLYVLQDADCLHWQAQHHFFEYERGSYVIQMWWLYMEGTRRDLWSSVPPKTAQRIFAGMLNESLTILASRYSQATPSSARLPLVINDICNILSCMAKLIAALSTGVREMTGESQTSQIVSQLHDKCHILFCCLIFKGAPVIKLHKALHGGLDKVECLKEVARPSISPWFAFVTDDIDFSVKKSTELPDKKAISLELAIVKSQPSASWHLLLKLLMMRNCWVALRIIKRVFSSSTYIGSDTLQDKCTGFMCNSECQLPLTSVEESIVNILITVASCEELRSTLINVLERAPSSWADHLDKNQIWNQKRPGWMEALVKPLYETLNPVINIIQRAINDSASIEQLLHLSVSLVERCVDCLPVGLHQACQLIESILPAGCSPLGDSVLIQLLFCALYTQLRETELAEALCAIDSQLLSELQQTAQKHESIARNCYALEFSSQMCDLLVSQLLLTKTGRISLMVMYKYIKEQCDWLHVELGESLPHPNEQSLLYTMFHIANKQFDQVLSRKWEIDWDSLLSIPLGISAEAIWDLVSSRLCSDDDGPQLAQTKLASDHLIEIFKQHVKHIALQ